MSWYAKEDLERFPDNFKEYLERRIQSWQV